MVRRRFLAAVAVWFWLAALTGDTLQERCDYMVGIQLVGTGGSLYRTCEPD